MSVSESDPILPSCGRTRYSQKCPIHQTDTQLQWGGGEGGLLSALWLQEHWTEHLNYLKELKQMGLCVKNTMHTTSQLHPIGSKLYSMIGLYIPIRPTLWINRIRSRLGLPDWFAVHTTPFIKYYFQNNQVFWFYLKRHPAGKHLNCVDCVDYTLVGLCALVRAG